MFFWVRAPCGLVGISQSFGEASHLHLQGSSNSSTRHLNSKTIIRIDIVVKTLSIAYSKVVCLFIRISPSVNRLSDTKMSSECMKLPVCRMVI
jgi:hypothetical protein